MKKIIILITLMIISFFISGLFFLNSGMFDDEWKFNKTRSNEILSDLDKLPLITIEGRFQTYKDDFEGFCTQDSDCNLPMEYAIQSNCPFGAKCINKKCRVVCPMNYHDFNPDSGVSYPYTCEQNSDCDCSEREDKTIECVCHNGNCFSVEA